MLCCSEDIFKVMKEKKKKKESYNQEYQGYHLNMKGNVKFYRQAKAERAQHHTSAL